MLCEGFAAARNQGGVRGGCGDPAGVGGTHPRPGTTLRKSLH